MDAAGVKAETLGRVRVGLGEKIRAWIRRPGRQLRLCESLSLGEKRLVAILQFEGQRYLVGATGASITLLSKLPDSSAVGSQQKGEACEG